MVCIRCQYINSEHAHTSPPSMKQNAVGAPSAINGTSYSKQPGDAVAIDLKRIQETVMRCDIYPAEN